MNIEYTIKFDKKNNEWVAQEEHTEDRMTFYGRGISPIMALQAIQESHEHFLTQYFNEEDSNGK